MKVARPKGVDLLTPLLKRAAVTPLHDKEVATDSDIIRLSTSLRQILRHGTRVRVLVIARS